MNETEFLHTMNALRMKHNEGTFLGEVNSRFVYVQFKATKNIHLQIEDTCSIGADNLTIEEWQQELKQLIEGNKDDTTTITH